MRLVAAQFQPIPADFEANLRKHVGLIQAAVANKADAICFPEMSLTGYVTDLADKLATDPEDARLDALQAASDSGHIVVCAGLPTQDEAGLHISLVIFQPEQKRRLHAKQHLYGDERSFFVPGREQLFIKARGVIIAPAICFESLQASHTRYAHEHGAQVYLASVANSPNGVREAHAYYPEAARRHAMTVLMANYAGTCGSFGCGGRSAAWNAAGECVAAMREETSGLAGLDTDTGEAILLEQND